MLRMSFCSLFWSNFYSWKQKKMKSILGANLIFWVLKVYIVIFIIMFYIYSPVWPRLSLAMVLLFIYDLKFYHYYFSLIKGRILTVAGVTIALCGTPFVAFSNLVAISLWPTWIVVAISETLRKVCNHCLSHLFSSKTCDLFIWFV